MRNRIFCRDWCSLGRAHVGERICARYTVMVRTLQVAVMAIKRPSKGRGTPSHKPVATAPLRHVDVGARQQMVPGEVYVGWLCKNRSCGLVIATAATAQAAKQRRISMIN